MKDLVIKYWRPGKLSFPSDLPGAAISLTLHLRKKIVTDF
jgi:hypothetical protein